MLSEEPDHALVAALLDIERHVGRLGWDFAPKVFALVPTTELLAVEPQLAQQWGITGEQQPMDGALTAIESEGLFTDPSADPVTVLDGIEWPAAVYGSAIALVRTFVPLEVEDAIPDDPAEAERFVADHPLRQEVRVVVGADRRGHHHGVARLASHPEDLLGAVELVPGLAAAVAHTLT